MEIKEKFNKIEYIANTISPYNYFSLGYLDIFYLAYYKDYNRYSLKDLRKYWLNYLHKNKTVYLNFYIHVPFCEVGCTYCKYFKDTQPSKEKIDKFLDYLEDYFIYFTDIFAKLKIVNLHIGGGTPSLLSVDQLKRLFELVNKYCNFEPINEIAFEINPKSITFAKLEILKANNVNRLAIGIQSLNSQVLETVDRNYYDYEYVKKMMKDIKSLSFKGTTLDLLFGLYKDTPINFMDTLKKTLALRPDRIHIYVVNPPRAYLQQYFNNDYNYFFKRINKLQKIVFPMIKQLLKNQDLYVCQDLSFRKKDYDIIKRFKGPKKRKHRKFGYTDTVEDCLAMFGIGKNSRSHLNNTIIYKDDNVDYLNFNINRKDFFGHDFYQEEFILKKFFKDLIDKQRVDLNEISSQFNVDFIEKYKAVIDYLENNKYVQIQDNIFKPLFQNAHQRFCGSLLFLNDKVINNIYQNCLNKTYE